MNQDCIQYGTNQVAAERVQEASSLDHQTKSIVTFTVEYERIPFVCRSMCQGAITRKSKYHYFRFLPPLAFVVGSADAPCVAPPPAPPLRFLPCCVVDLSLFFTHLSGSGMGVTPNTTPFGNLTFFSCFAFTGAGLVVVVAEGREGRVEGMVGGGADSSEAATAAGSASSERRYPVWINSSCCSTALMLFWISVCSSASIL